MKLQKKYLLFVLLIALFGCKPEKPNAKTDLQIDLLTPFIKMTNDTIGYDFGDPVKANVVEFVFKNTSNYNYVMLSSHTNLIKNGILSLECTKLYPQGEEAIHYQRGFVCHYPGIFEEDTLAQKKEQDDVNKYHSLNPGTEKSTYDECMISNLCSQSYILLPAHTSTYFKVHLGFPFNHIGYNDYSGEAYKLTPNQPYEISLYFDKIDKWAKGYLTETALKNIKKNNYIIFEGELESNKVPVKFD